MKVLFDHSLPFVLAHGGFQIQIEQSKMALEQAGVQVEYLRWWDDSSRADIIHYFGRPAPEYLALARQKGMRVVMSELLSALGARPPLARAVQRIVTRAVQTATPGSFTTRLAWDSFRLADACIALTPWEAQLMSEIFRAPPERVHWIPNGVEAVFLEPVSGKRGQWLVCTATIRDLKRVLELAQAAVQAQTPLWMVGKPYHPQDPYAVRFTDFARTHGSLVRYEGPISDRAKLAQVYREARGFVLLSKSESLSLSALEAAACRCPLLLADLPWARSVFQNAACYCPVTTVKKTATVLKEFYNRAPELAPPPRPQSWGEVALSLKSVYERVLKKP